MLDLAIISNTKSDLDVSLFFSVAIQKFDVVATVKNTMNRATSQWSQSCHPRVVTSVCACPNLWYIKLGSMNFGLGQT